jgi:DNA-binding PadR family transcriptional regulator
MASSREGKSGRVALRRVVLTELEGCVLGIVWSQGPCTAYAARRVFLDSPSPYWSGSAGAVYPLLVRLEDRGLVRARAHSLGLRASRRFGITPPGRRMLERWLGPPLPDWILGIPMDPLRTRMGFLGALPAQEQSARRERRLRGPCRQGSGREPGGSPVLAETGPAAPGPEPAAGDGGGSRRA